MTSGNGGQLWCQPSEEVLMSPLSEQKQVQKKGQNPAVKQ